MNTTTLSLSASIDDFYEVISVTGSSPPISGAGSFNLPDRYGNFYQIYEKVLFKEATVHANNSGPVTFELLSGHTGTFVISSVTVNVVPGIQTIPINLVMDPGRWGTNFTITNTQNSGTSARRLRRTAGSINYPLNITDPLRGTIGRVLSSYVADRYYWFYSPKFVKLINSYTLPITGQSPTISTSPDARVPVDGVFGNFYEIYQPVIFKRATINAFAAGTVIFEMRQGHSTTGPLISSVTVNVLSGVQTIPLNLLMDSNRWGNKFTIAKANNENPLFPQLLSRTPFTPNFPFIISDPIYGEVGRVTGTNVPEFLRYYWFYSPVFEFTPAYTVRIMPPFIVKGATALNLSLTGISEEDLKVNTITINWGDGSLTDTFKREIFFNYKTNSIFNEVLYGKLGGSILGAYNHNYINQTKTYGVPYNMNIIVQKDNGVYLNFRQPISSFWGSYYDNLNNLSILTTQILPVTSNASFVNFECNNGSVFAARLE